MSGSVVLDIWLLLTQISALHEVYLPLPALWLMLACLMACAGKNDVFVKVSAITGAPDYHVADARSSTIEEGGKTPVWQGQHGGGEEITLVPSPFNVYTK